jgi:hypothetical protein
MAIKANIVIDQGTDYETVINVTDENGDIVDLTGYTGAAQMRKHFSSSAQTAFTVAVSNTYGTVTLSMNSATTNAVSAGRYVYDCELRSSANIVSRLIEGIVTVTPQVTR